MPGTNQYLISDFGFEEKLPPFFVGDPMPWVTVAASKQSLFGYPLQNTLHPAGAHLEGNWECVKPTETASINKCHMDVSQQDRKGLAGKMSGSIEWKWYEIHIIFSPLLI